ncbi:hypothetical protein FRC03_003772 [Tulasnella sp. 419]|nr:hypothetical protein FRC03_003772 [Tulasnella sp. 419]
MVSPSPSVPPESIMSNDDGGRKRKAPEQTGSPRTNGHDGTQPSNGASRSRLVPSRSASVSTPPSADPTKSRRPSEPLRLNLTMNDSTPEGGMKRLTVPFFRYFGPTANTPGYRRVKVRTLTIDETASPQSSPTDTLSSSMENDFRSQPPAQYKDGHPFLLNAIPTSPQSVTNSAGASNLFDAQRTRYPSSVHLPHLAGLFFDHMSCHFPFLDRAEVMRAVEDETLPAVLANVLAALACRFSDRPELLKGKRQIAGEAYADMAKLLIVHMLSWPSLEVLQALILLSWAEFGGGRDSGLWMYSRMAVAMAMDLGLHRENTVQLASSDAERDRIRFTWWSVFLVDRINSWGTGRPIAIADDQFDTALPVPFHADDVTKPPPISMVFGQLCGLVQLRGRLGDVLNNLVKRHSETSGSVELQLTQLQYEMTAWYQSLSPSLVFNIQNFRRFVAHQQSSIFLLLHCMFHSVITLLHRPSLLQSFTPEVAISLSNSIDVSRSSARSLVDMVNFADEIDANALIANPFLDLPILTAARAFLAEREFLAKPQESMTPLTVMLMRQWSENSLIHCKEALKKMSKYWGGVGCVMMILEQQSKGDMDFEVGEGQSSDYLAHIRDVELLTQWATKAWRRHFSTGKKNLLPKPPVLTKELANPNFSVASTNPIVPPISNPATNALHQAFVPSPPTNSNGILGPYFHESPNGASVGITGMLDGPYMASDGLLHGSSSDEGALRVSFNSAEADLSFPNLNSTELFSIPDGLEELLGSTMMSDVLRNNGPSSSATHSNSPSTAALLGVNQVPESSSLSFPAFSTLIGPWFPMDQFSRAPSPAHPSNHK